MTLLEYMNANPFGTFVVIITICFSIVHCVDALASAIRDRK
jgi:hypothetical protein